MFEKVKAKKKILCIIFAFLAVTIGISSVAYKVNADNRKKEEIAQQKKLQVKKEQAEKQRLETEKKQQEARKKEEEQKKQEEKKKEEEQKKQQEKKKEEEQKKQQEANQKAQSHNTDNNKPEKNKLEANNSNSQAEEKGFKNAAFNGCSQVLLVTNSTKASSSAVVNCYEKSDGHWKNIRSNMSSLIGGNGMQYDSLRKQSTNTTPAGIYNVLYMFGWGGNPGVNYIFKVPNDNSYWNLNDGSPTYNRWVEGNPGGDCEHLKYYKTYKYSIVTDYNYGQQRGKGGAIFIHLSSGRSTAGCVSLSEDNLLYIMRWLNPSKNPKILICPEKDLSKYYY